MCVLNLDLLDIVLNEDKNAVMHVTCANCENTDRKIKVRAKFFVLCLGGIENPRTLLNANKQIPNGIGNGNDLVGRFFNEHLHATVGELLLNKEVPSQFVSPTNRFREQFSTLNFGLRVYTQDGRLPHNRYRRAKKLGFLKSMSCKVPFADRLSEIIRGHGISCNNDGELWISSEQSLNPDSRITLSNEVDRYGLKKVNLIWRIQDLDFHTM